jgi:hypothetical protein
MSGSVKKAPVVYTKSVKLVHVAPVVEVKNKNMFAGMVCSDAEEEEDSDESVMDFENDPIIWGVGLTSMVGKRWADVVGC